MPTVYYAHKHQDLDAVHYLIQKEHNIMGIESVSVLQWQLLSWIVLFTCLPTLSRKERNGPRSQNIVLLFEYSLKDKVQ